MVREKQTGIYEPPTVEVIEVEVEKGFAASDGNGEDMKPKPGYW